MNKYKINSIITTASVLICIVIINIIVNAVCDKKPLRIDLTRESIYSFSEQTEEVMKNLDDKVSAYALIPVDLSNEHIEYVRYYLDKYNSLSDNFEVKYVDPYTNPTFVKKYQTNGENIDIGSIIIEQGDNFKILNFNELYYQNTAENYISIDMERKMTSAITEVCGNGEEIKVCFTQGHGEFECSNLTKLFTNEGYKCKTLNILTDEISDDTDLLVISDPTRDFSEEEILSLEKYTNEGGQIMMFFQPGMDMGERLSKYCNNWGITINNDYIIESDKKHSINSQYGTIPVLVQEKHKITEELIEQKLIFAAPAARSIELNENNIYGAKLTSLMKTSDKAYSKNSINFEIPLKEDGDKLGPFDVSVMGEKYIDENKTARLLVHGSLASLETDTFLTQNNYANSDFILNAITYMCDNTGLLNIRAKQVSPEALVITESQAQRITVIVLYILPVIIFLAGAIIWFRRRYR